MKAFKLTSTRFVIAVSTAVLSIASIIGSVMYLRSIRPAMFGLDCSYGSPEKLKSSLMKMSSKFKTAPPPGKEDVYTPGPTDVDTDKEVLENAADAEAQLKTLLELSKQPFGTDPSPDLKIYKPEKPTEKHKIQSYLKEIPKDEPSPVVIEELAKRTFTVRRLLRSDLVYVIKVLKVKNVLGKKDLEALIIFFANDDKPLRIVEGSNDDDLKTKLGSLDGIKELIKEFSMKKTIIDQGLDDDYELLQADSPVIAAPLQDHILTLIKHPQRSNKIGDILKQAMGNHLPSHIAILMNNRINTMLKSIIIDDYQFTS